jgi:NADH:ubiquinone oxidoreductase subunit F (NADH-binding)
LPLAELLDLAGGVTVPIQAFLIGGYFGTWVAAEDALPLSLSDAGLAGVGARLGAGTIVALPSTICGVVETALLARYLAGESAGQCAPCIHGLDALATAVGSLAGPRHLSNADDRQHVRRWAGQVYGRGACRHPDGAARLIESALAVFADELARHASGKCSGDGRGFLRRARAAR